MSKVFMTVGSVRMVIIGYQETERGTTIVYAAL